MSTLNKRVLGLRKSVRLALTTCDPRPGFAWDVELLREGNGMDPVFFFGVKVRDELEERESGMLQ